MHFLLVYLVLQVFLHMVLIFHSFKDFSDLSLIYMFFRSGADFGRLTGNLLGSLLKYNVLEDFQEILQILLQI
ncbi:hypothetical protein IGI04_039494 [Brassica rapa subsp. trilocularis]|uniref:Uncharacterized protein n=1 Tax=Brassica rapa subsp. trilocularis TaxID=1813537 RepID=A0ABQ7KL16_BRACM|nr:hypothetical protein IGI04_039494 [Brassica rapa subsp. trilocularis]